MAAPTADKVYIVLLNWNTHADTLDCLISLQSLQHPNFQIILLDNDSQRDDSLRIFLDIFSGRSAHAHAPRWAAALAETDYQLLEEDFSVTETGQFGRGRFAQPLVIIRNRDNYGFAGGNNVGMRYALQHGGDFSACWLLNTDTTTAPDALQRMEACYQADPGVGMVGSVLIYFDRPDTVQTVGGGRFFPLLATAKLYHKNLPVSQISQLDAQTVNGQLDYLMGASLLVRRSVMEQVGLFDEDYFVYVEEVDWMHRLKKAGWRIAVALDSFVYHKDSASTRDRREFFYYLLNKNNQVFLRKHYPFYYNLFSIGPVLLNTLRLTQRPKNLRYTLKGIWEGIRYRPS